MFEKGLGSKRRRIAKYLEDGSGDSEYTQVDIVRMVKDLEFCEPGSSKYMKQAPLLQKLSCIAAADQELAISTGSTDGVFDSTEYVVQAFVSSNKMSLLLDLLGDAIRTLPTTTTNSDFRNLLSNVIKSLFILLKCCSDTRDAFSIFNRSSFFTVISYVSIVIELVKLDDSIYDFASVCATLYIYCIYNAARHAEDMQLGVPDEIFNLVGTHRCVPMALSIYEMQGLHLSEECFMTLAEFFAILAESEVFLDYVGIYFDVDTTSAFLRFYQTVVQKIMKDQDERRKMLSLDEIISFIKQRHAEVWAAHISASNEN